MNQYNQLLLLIIIIIIIIIFIKSNKNEVLIIESPLDKQNYLVNNYLDKYDAANLLAQIRINILKLRKYLIENKKKYKHNKEYIELLDKRCDKIIIKENTENNNFTSYSVNKGEEIIFCLRSKIDNSLHDINMMMYVAIHEIAHVACPEIGHTPLFKKIFKFFLETGIKLNIYEYVNYENNIQEYCGIYIDQSILS
jgi:predicted metal-dependent hydrolase